MLHHLRLQCKSPPLRGSWEFPRVGIAPSLMPDLFERGLPPCHSLDGQDFSDIEAYGVERWLAELALALRQETYRPEPIRRVFYTEGQPQTQAAGHLEQNPHFCERPRFGPPGCALNRPTWSPVKGSSARVSPNRLSYGCPTTIFLDPRNRHRHHLSATLLDGRAGNGWARLLRCGRDRSDGGVSECWL